MKTAKYNSFLETFNRSRCTINISKSKYKLRYSKYSYSYHQSLIFCCSTPNPIHLAYQWCQVSHYYIVKLPMPLCTLIISKLRTSLQLQLLQTKLHLYRPSKSHGLSMGNPLLKIVEYVTSLITFTSSRTTYKYLTCCLWKKQKCANAAMHDLGHPQYSTYSPLCSKPLYWDDILLQSS